jgi:methionyl-tRNA formyltransferase
MAEAHILPSVVFAGSHVIAQPLLNFLHREDKINHHLRLTGVISQPDRPFGRGKKTTPTIIAQWALDHHIPLHRPEKPDENTIKWLQEQSCDLLLVMAYGHMIGKTIRKFPRLGIFNFHASLLPRFRGATPIEAALASGITETGVTLMEITREMDAGDLLGSITAFVNFYDTQTELTHKLSHAACSLCEQFLPQLLLGNTARYPQPSEGITFCRKLEAPDRFLDFHVPALMLHQRIRALTPRPGCVFEIEDKIFKIWSTDVDKEHFYAKIPGTLLKLSGSHAAITAGDGHLLLLKEIQVPGKQRMSIDAYLRGHELPWGHIAISHTMKPLEHTNFPF